MSRKNARVEDDDPLDQEIDFSSPRPNPFARDYGRNRNLRILDPNLLAVFPDSESVNEALRTFIRLTAATPPKDQQEVHSASKAKKGPRVR
jgi:hypothetical protein